MMLLSGWCGDALGAQVEFMNRRFLGVEMDDIMEFRGVSNGMTERGRITDDSELEICLLDALVEGKLMELEYFPIEEIALKYKRWFDSDPIDVGYSVTMALSHASNAEEMMEQAIMFNNNSQSNGSMMRIAALVIFMKDKTFSEICELVELEVSLTHSNPIILLSSSIYCYILVQLLNDISIDDVLMNVIMYTKNTEIEEWTNEGINMKSLDEYNSIKICGHVKHSYVILIYVLKQLKEKKDYEYYISMVLQCGGDTDTNAKIVGSMLGAYGLLPRQSIIDFVLDADNSNIRPKWCSLHHGLSLLEAISTK